MRLREAVYAVWPLLCTAHCCAAPDLQAITDDMLRKLAPRFGVQLPPELQQREDASSSTSSNSSSSGGGGDGSKLAVNPGSRGASVYFPGDFKMAPVDSL